MPEPLRITGDGLVLREWTSDDLPVMAELFDDPAVAHRTPLVSPFDEAAARDYLQAIRESEGKRINLAITTDGLRPLGEILLSLTRCTIGYAVGAAHRGQRLAPRATRLLTEYAHTTLGLPRVLLQIEPDNGPSVAVADRLGFRLTDEEPEHVTGKGGRVYTLLTWAHETDG